ncbi:group II intron reverse transcriptase/maturase, partial [Lacticaseibacillus paracasei]
RESPERITPEYRELHNEIKRISHRLKKLEGEEKAKVLLEYQEKRKRLTTLPCTSQTNKVLKYVRYADDFIISVKGSKEDCQW